MKAHSHLYPDYYKAVYMLLIAICEPQGPSARVWVSQALGTFRRVLRSDSETVKWLTVKSRALLETMVFISSLVNVHLGSSAKKREEPTQVMEEVHKEDLRAKSLEELGFAIFKVHAELLG